MQQRMMRAVLWGLLQGIASRDTGKKKIKTALLHTAEHTRASRNTSDGGVRTCTNEANAMWCALHELKVQTVVDAECYVIF